MKVGVVIIVNDVEVDAKFKKAADLGFKSCQINCWNHKIMGDELAANIKAASEKYGVEISSAWIGWSGPAVWNFIEGPTTLGIVPREHREARVEELIHGADFAKKVGVGQVITHFGFLPEAPSDPEYPLILEAIKKIAEHCKKNGQKLLFETGQETPITLLRVIEDTGFDNLGINLDPANLLMYGKANPVDAIGVFGKYVCDVHAKDGKYPTEGRNLGPETALGEGDVNFPALVKALREAGYDGPLTIEREIEGEEQTRDIILAKKMLEDIIG